MILFVLWTCAILLHNSSVVIIVIFRLYTVQKPNDYIFISNVTEIIYIYLSRINRNKYLQQ